MRVMAKSLSSGVSFPGPVTLGKFLILSVP